MCGEYFWKVSRAHLPLLAIARDERLTWIASYWRLAAQITAQNPSLSSAPGQLPSRLAVTIGAEMFLVLPAVEMRP